MGETDRDDLISIIEEQDETPDIPEELPLLPVRDVVIFTDMVLPAGRNRYTQWKRPWPARINS